MVGLWSEQTWRSRKVICGRQGVLSDRHGWVGVTNRVKIDELQIRVGLWSDRQGGNCGGSGFNI